MLSFIFVVIAVILMFFVASGIYSYVHQVKHVEGVLTHESDARIWGMPPNTFVLTMALSIGIYLLIVLFPYRSIIYRANRVHKIQTAQIDSLKQVNQQQQNEIAVLDSVVKQQQLEIDQLKKKIRPYNKGKIELSVGSLRVSADSLRGIVR